MNKFINEEKILNYLDELKIPLVKVCDNHQIHIHSSISNLKKLVEFVEPFHYYISYIGIENTGFISINPK